jgi:hypothetical protein
MSNVFGRRAVVVGGLKAIDEIFPGFELSEVLAQRC